MLHNCYYLNPNSNNPANRYLINALTMGNMRTAIKAVTLFKADLNLIINDMSLVHYFVKLDNLQALRILVFLGANINSKIHKKRITPLFLSIKLPSVDCLEFLITNKANMCATNNLGESIIIYLIKKYTYAGRMMQVLWDLGSGITNIDRCINLFDKGFTSPLLHAIALQDIESVSFLLKNGANPNYSMFPYNSPLQICVKNNLSFAYVALLIDYGANLYPLHEDLSCTHNFENHPLIKKMRIKYTHLYNSFLAELEKPSIGFGIRETNEDSYAILHSLRREAWFTRGKDEYGNNLLHLLALYSSTQFVSKNHKLAKALVEEFEISPCAYNHKGLTPLGILRSRHNPALNQIVCYFGELPKESHNSASRFL